MNRNELNVVNNVQCSFVRKVVGGKLNYIKIKKKKEKKNKVCFMLQFYFIDGHCFVFVDAILHYIRCSRIFISIEESKKK